jgi:transglutaminase-like putative cysteine protease
MYICSQSSQPRIYLGQIPKGYAGTRKTVGYIIGLIKEGAKDFDVRQIDILFQHAVRPKDYLGEIRALFEWVKNNVRYTRDIHRVELLHTARRMLELRAGDCDDMTILLGRCWRPVRS